jgi:PKD repeat protein
MKSRINLFKSLAILTILVLSTSAAAGSARAQAPDYELAITIGYHVSCGEGEADVEFSISWEPAEVETYRVYVDFGDGDGTEEDVSGVSTLVVNHSYTDHGDYEIVVKVTEIIDLAGLEALGVSGQVMEVLTLEGPEVTILSEPTPPVFVVGEEGLVNFTAVASEGTLPYVYEWDLGGGETTKTFSTDTASATYTEEGKYEVEATVTDNCGFTASASVPVLVASPEEACHPTAQKIADAVSTLFPDQAGQEYTCEDIYALFDNEEGGNNIGFGRMWMAYHLADSIELSWEEMLAWHMDDSGWGSLMQLNRFAEVLSEQGISDLIGLVMSEDYTLGDVRTAIRSVTRFEADFDDALARIEEGATPGDLSQFYGLVAELGADYETLDEYLADGMTLPELKHSANFAERMGADWTEIADFRSLYGDNWGELKQAYSLATEEDSAAEILAIGVQEYSKGDKSDEQVQRTAAKLADQYSAELDYVMTLFEGTCEGNWACVRSTLRDHPQENSSELPKKDSQTSLQISTKYGYTQAEVLAYYQNSCDSNWACTRAYYKNLSKNTK